VTKSGNHPDDADGDHDTAEEHSEDQKDELRLLVGLPLDGHRLVAARKPISVASHSASTSQGAFGGVSVRSGDADIARLLRRFRPVIAVPEPRGREWPVAPLRLERMDRRSARPVQQASGRREADPS
jgi:hypothetical protein